MLPTILLTLLVTLASGSAFCLLMGTPATVMTLSSGHVHSWNTIRWGVILKLAVLVVLLLVQRFVWPLMGLAL